MSEILVQAERWLTLETPMGADVLVATEAKGVEGGTFLSQIASMEITTTGMLNITAATAAPTITTEGRRLPTIRLRLMARPAPRMAWVRCLGPPQSIMSTLPRTRVCSYRVEPSAVW